MVWSVPDDRASTRGDRWFAWRQGQDRQAQCRREPAYRDQIRHPVDPDADDLQERPDGLAPDRRCAQAEARAVDHRGGVTIEPESFCATAGRTPAACVIASG